MARYFFNMQSEPDLDGTEFDSETDAKCAAVQFAGSLLTHEPSLISASDTWRLEVADEGGMIIYALTVAASDAPQGKALLTA
ncbi:DUF6894 family protein [Sphingobium baderi]|uniref:DUF6894 family protein n=1 Tax=Sphingobium baderi TaxID=1332080 RepID=UPI002B40C5C5|nr:hypothetical protein [Sphingobium baderi]WRD78845.1 hypothetical protein QQ987_19415 [Sphingobium baderi]